MPNLFGQTGNCARTGGRLVAPGEAGRVSEYSIGIGQVAANNHSPNGFSLAAILYLVSPTTWKSISKQGIIRAGGTRTSTFPDSSISCHFFPFFPRSIHSQYAFTVRFTLPYMLGISEMPQTRLRQ